MKSLKEIKGMKERDISLLKKAIMSEIEIILRIHTKPDADVYVTIEYIKKKGVKIKFITYETSGGRNKGMKWSDKSIVIPIDILKGELDHHGKKKKTSLHMAMETLGDKKNEKWLKPILSQLLLIDSYGEGLFGDIGTIGKALVHAGLEDSEILKIGCEAARLILEFHEKRLKRNQTLTQKIIKEFFTSKKMPQAFVRYMSLLNNERFERFCDLCEIVSAKEEVDGTKKAEKLGQELVFFLWKEYGEEYQKGQKEAKRAKKIRIRGTREWIALIDNCQSPKTHVILLNEGALAVIQRASNMTVQVFFNSKLITEKLIRTGKIENIRKATDLIIKGLRKTEIILDQRIPCNDLTSPETIINCTEWYYFLGEKRRSGKRGVFIFNGSFTAPDVPRTKIPLDGIASVVVLSFESL